MSKKTPTHQLDAIDFENGIPLHLQVRDIIRHEALNDKIVDANGKMPTEFEFVKRFGVSRITIRNALQTLVEEGLLVRERGRGTFLKTNQPENWVGQLMGFTETIKEAGFTPGAQILEMGMTKKISDNVKNALGSQVVWELKRLRFADDKPIAIEHAFFPVEIGLELETQDLLSIAIYKFLEEELHTALTEAKQMISAVNANEYESGQLRIEENEALLYMERTTYSTDRKPVEFLKAVYCPDYFQYMVQLTRKHPHIGFTPNDR
jgi:GntR family transcriptional regulator